MRIGRLRFAAAVALVAVVFAGVPFACAADTAYRVGVAKVDVTPGYPVRMSGYASRMTEFAGVKQPLFAKALAIAGGDQPPVVLVTVDSLGVSAPMTAAVAEGLKAKHGIPVENVVIAASHTHSAPALAHTARLIFPPPVPKEHVEHMQRYEKELTEHLAKVAEEAVASMRPGRLSWGTGKVTFAVNRRALKEGRWTGFGVVPEGAVDHSLPVLFVHDVPAGDPRGPGKLRAVLVNYACHCTTLGGAFNEVHGDWAGCAQEQIEREHEGVTALVSIGCGADANPNPRKDDLTIVQQHGDEIAREVRRLEKSKLTPISGIISARREVFDLPLAELPTKAEFEERTKQTGKPIAWHAQAQLDRLAQGEKLRTSVPYSAHVWLFGKSLAMVSLPGEVVVDYQLRLKRELDGRRLWVNAYSNDSPCYIASKRVLAEGGYEVDGSMYYYDQPQHFAPAVEDTLISHVRTLVPSTFDAGERFAEAVAKLEANGKSDGYPNEPILFIGSSTIVRWKLDRWFSDLPTVNHGFGGSYISDSVHFFDRLVKPVKPRQIVFFAGSNDLAAGKTPEQVRDDFLRLAAEVRKNLPETKLTYIAITPSIKRWSQIERQRKTNALIQAEVEKLDSPKVEFVALEKLFLGENGEPVPANYVADQLHLSDAGYAILVDVVKPYLVK
jgi:lysophospholipase L1-like esterase